MYSTMYQMRPTSHYVHASLLSFGLVPPGQYWHEDQPASEYTE